MVENKNKVKALALDYVDEYGIKTGERYAYTIRGNKVILEVQGKAVEITPEMFSKYFCIF